MDDWTPPKTPAEFTEFATDFLKLQGATVVGVSTTETLAGGPPSTDLEYVLPGAKSAVTFAVPFDQEKIERYLAKQDHAGHQSDNFHTNFFVTGLAVGLADYWNQQRDPLLRGALERGLPPGHAPRHPGLHAGHLPPLPGRALRRRLVRALGQRHHQGARRCDGARQRGHHRRARAHRAASARREVLRRVQALHGELHLGPDGRQGADDRQPGRRGVQLLEAADLPPLRPGLRRLHRPGQERQVVHLVSGAFPDPGCGGGVHAGPDRGGHRLGAAPQGGGRLPPPGDARSAQAQHDLRQLPADLPPRPATSASAATSCSPRAAWWCRTRTAPSRRLRPTSPRSTCPS